jgi:hypothetical protein
MSVDDLCQHCATSVILPIEHSHFLAGGHASCRFISEIQSIRVPGFARQTGL